MAPPPPRSFLNSKSGFTMIELLCVIIIVGALTASAMPNFLDFRKEARLAVVRMSLNTMRMGIKNAKQQILLRCGAPLDAYLSHNVINGNTLVTGTDWAGPPGSGTCPTTIPVEERKLWTGFTGAPAVLPNPFHPTSPRLLRSTGFSIIWTGCSCAQTGSTGGIGVIGTNAWVHNRETNIICAGTDVAGECDL